MSRTLLLAACLLASCGTPASEPHPYYAIDGDTIAVAAGPHIRLLYIDAPEMPGHCRLGRQCVEGDPYAAKIFLQHLLEKGDMTCKDGDAEGRTRDVYGRRLSDCWITPPTGNEINLSQAMLDSGLVGLYQRTPRYER